ncbi:hypothetical protein NLG97_g8073 [Lecanicillium saksenae]|uniref:Uncharacterized protein n=1 Tax=Lecanicillium saksenae TaxID=468837 RepID=A0ACC1QNT6_9HYPO|nr:hypothetical protein NLG97_g8073 [Lecanicillium saksenae]
MSTQVWLITGVSNGFGLLLTLKALGAKHHVIGTVRSKAKSADAVRQITDAGGHVIELDMSDSQNDIIAKIQDAEKIYGPVDVLVNNAGYNILGALEQFSEDEVKLQYQTNVFGPLFATQAVLPGMRARRRGCIVNMSSSVGQDAAATCSVYGGSKFALEGMTEALRAEVREFGVDVVLVEPGMFRTNLFHARQAPRAALPDDYGDGVVGRTMAIWDCVRAMAAAVVWKDEEEVVVMVVGMRRRLLAVVMQRERGVNRNMNVLVM